MLRMGFIVLTTILAAFGQEQPKTVRISGKVVDTTNSAIPNIIVKLRAVGNDQPVAEVKTDQNGLFLFPTVPAQPYRLDFYAGGHWSTMLQAANAAAGGNLDVGSVRVGIGIETGRVVPFNASTLPKSLMAETDSSNIGCVQRLEIPGYLRLALVVRIQGTITTSVLLSPTGTPLEITTQRQGTTEVLTNGLRMLVPSIEEAIKKSSFRSECGGKTVRLVFRFEIKGAFRDNPTASFAFGFPNEFWISTPPLPQEFN